THIKIALGYFFVIALLGVLLRLFQIVNISINYKYILHSHSHIALLGWIYTGLTTLIYKLYLVDKPIDKKYKLLFWSTQVTVIGMLVTFPFMGYAMLSIIFSTLFLIVSYLFVYLFLKHTSTKQKKTYSYKLIRAALWFMVLSSIGPWTLGVIMNTLGSTSSWYRNAIYFYLHFQYNGWFIIALFGILFFVFEKYSIHIPKNLFKVFFRLFTIGVVLTFALSVLWMKPHPVFYILAGVGGLFQMVAFGVLFRKILQNKEVLKTSLSKIEGILLKTVTLLIIVKLIFQILGAFPSIAEIISSNIDFVIGYLHWIFLGVVSISIFAFLNHFKLMVISKNNYIIYLIGFILTESLIIYKGTVIWLGYPLLNNYYTFLAVASVLFFLAILILFMEQFRSQHRND
ncbi:MAG: hypothetical protein KAJ28_12605, partial [Flavobacteriaceae bacterium]|nr:hypothetical protein [Flavobacteriaceae bacterium]